MTSTLRAARPRRHPNLVTHLVVVGFLATFLGAGATVGTAVSASAVTVRSFSTSAMAPSTYEKRVQAWVNVHRKKRGLRPLRMQSCTDQVAERWSRHLAANDAFYHQSMRYVLRRCDARYAGETLGRGSISPKRVVRMWMRSPGHRAILTSRKPRRIGIAAVPDARGRWVVTADFTRL